MPAPTTSRPAVSAVAAGEGWGRRRLLAINVILLIVGTVMDIFSAIVVVVPLILPLADAYQITYVHLGVIFIANLELGYLHPPLGLNLLLASYRFKKSVLEVTWATLPMLGILAVGVE